MTTVSRITSISMAIVLGLCLLKMPYSYYQFVRIFCFIGFIFLSVQDKEVYGNWKSIVFSGLAVLFNPVFPIHMSRYTWNIIDVTVAAGLLLLSLLPIKRKEPSI